MNQGIQEITSYKKYKNKFNKNISTNFNKSSNNKENSKIETEEKLVNF